MATSLVFVWFREQVIIPSQYFLIEFQVTAEEYGLQFYWGEEYRGEEHITMPIAKIIANGHSTENLTEYDASLIFTDGSPTAESIKIIFEDKRCLRAYLHINIRAAEHDDTVRQIVTWLEGNGNNNYETYQAIPPEHCRLNLAINKGSRPSDIDSIVMQILVEVLRQVNPECRNFVLSM